MEDPVDLEVRTHIEVENQVGNNLPGVLVSGIEFCADSSWLVTLVSIDDHSGTRRVHIDCKFPFLPNVPSDLNINRMLQADVVQCIIE